MTACTDRNVTLENLQTGFSAEAYLDQLRSCADSRTSADEIESIYKTYFTFDKSSAGISDRKGLGKSDLSLVMKYKLTRGKWRPRLQGLIEQNSSEACIECANEALRLVGYGKGGEEEEMGKKDEENDNLETIMSSLSCFMKLKGVGIATATLLLSIFSPSVPFFSDEFAAFHSSSSSLGAAGTKLKYDVKEYRALLTRHLSWLRKQNEEFESVVTSIEAEAMIWYFLRTRTFQKTPSKASLTLSTSEKKRDNTNHDLGSTARKRSKK